METRVKELREARKISQTTLGVYCGCSQNMISKIELGYCDPKASLLLEMSKYFGVSVDYILCQTEHRNYNELHVHYRNQTDLMRRYVESLNKLSNKSKVLVKDIADRLVEIEQEHRSR